MVMKQENMHHVQTKTYPLNPQSRAYYLAEVEQPAAGAGLNHDGHDDAREWQNPSRFGRHRTQ
jgi:hypothetical protein